MIPNFTDGGVLPPFLDNPDGPAVRAAMAPYKTTLADILGRFATSPERISILRGVLNYRKRLKGYGVTQGYQWIDGSFVEDCEKLRERPPKDIDVVTFAYRPEGLESPITWREFVEVHKDTIFNNDYCKEHYQTDAFYIDLHTKPHLLVDNARYWFGLLSHQRGTYIWKGCLHVDLVEDEDNLLMECEGLQNA